MAGGARASWEGYVGVLDQLQDGAKELVHQLPALREPLAEQAVRVHLHQLPPSPRHRRYASEQVGGGAPL